MEYAVASDHCAVNWKYWSTVISQVTAAGVAEPADPANARATFAAVNAECHASPARPIPNTVPAEPKVRLLIPESHSHITAVRAVASAAIAPVAMIAVPVITSVVAILWRKTI